MSCWDASRQDQHRHGGRFACALSSLCLRGSLFLLGPCLPAETSAPRVREHSEHSQPKPRLASLEQDNVGNAAIHPSIGSLVGMTGSTSTVLLCCIAFILFHFETAVLGTCSSPTPTPHCLSFLDAGITGVSHHRWPGGGAIHERKESKAQSPYRLAGVF